jgi:hypothetical protein
MIQRGQRNKNKKKEIPPRGGISLYRLKKPVLKSYYMAEPEAAPCILTSTFSVRPA